MATTRKQRIIRTLTPKRVKRAQARWRRRKKKIVNARAKFREVWHGDVVVNGRRPARNKAKAKVPTPRKPASAEPRRARRDRPAATAESPRPKCDGTCTNSDMEPDEAKAQGLCGMCCGRKELVTNFGGKHVHVSCGECDGSGLASVAAWRKASKHGGGVHGHEAGRQRPSRNEAAQKAAPWVAGGSVLMALFTVFGLSFWFVAAGATAMAIGAAAYRHHRKHGVPEHGASADRKATRQAARQAGCSAACMWSLKPADTCRCPCGGTTHGSAHKRKAAAA